ncbi:MAG TPA: hypothetical protein VJ024_09875 [Thermodesulfovibrionales bacterium]|nr:hypothetical protein [Thermodesulfovibrionales bacterium]
MLKTDVAKKILTSLQKHLEEELDAVILYGSYAEDRKTSYSGHHKQRFYQLERKKKG